MVLGGTGVRLSNTGQSAIYQSFWRAFEKNLLGVKRAEIRSVRAQANCRSAWR
jgi:hypothetical protein